MGAARISNVILAAALVTTMASCGWVPLPGGAGTASPETPDPAGSGADTAQAAVSTFLNAWRARDERAIDRISNGAGAAITRSAFPDPAPKLVACGLDTMIAGAVSCMYSIERRWLYVVASPGSSDRWKVIATRLRPR